MSTVINPTITLIDDVEHRIVEDGKTKPLFRFAFGLIAPDQSITSGWEHLPTIGDQLRYLREHHDTRDGVTVYKPVLLLQVLEPFADGWFYVNIQHFDTSWSSIDLESFDNGNWITEALKGSPPAIRHLQPRPMHSITGIPVGKCLGDCKRVLDSKRDGDAALCIECIAR